MRSFLLLLMVACCMLACKKSESISPGLFGKWELRKMVGGFAGYDSAYTAGNGRIMKFNSDSTYQQYNNNKLITQGTFHIWTYHPQSGSPYLQISFNGNEPYGDMINLQGNQLTIGEDSNDGIASSYEKIDN